MSTMKKNKMNAFDWINYFLLFVFAIITLYPFVYVVVGSFSSGPAFNEKTLTVYPLEATFDNYLVVFKDSRLWRAFLNTLFKTAIGTVTSVLFTSLVGYAMSRKELKFRSAFYFLNLFTMFFGGGLIPYFLIITLLGLYNNFMVYIIPTMYSVYNMIICSNFFKSIPNELRESAMIDGAGEFTIIFKMYFPLSVPVLATIALWQAVGHWNNYMMTMLYTKGDTLITLQYYLMKVIKEASVDLSGMNPAIQENVNATTVSFAAIVTATLPIIFLYPAVQKYFTQGILMGSLKD